MENSANNENLKARIKSETVAAMRSKDKDRLAALRLLSSEIKQREVDNRIELDDAACLAVIDKMLSQRKESLKQFLEASREDLAQKEQFEISIYQEFLPPQLSEDEINDLINATIKSTAASSMRDMGKVMAELKPQLQGRADMSNVSKKIKELLS